MTVAWVDDVRAFHAWNCSSPPTLLAAYHYPATNHLGRLPAPTHPAAPCAVTRLSTGLWYYAVVRRLATLPFPLPLTGYRGCYPGATRERDESPGVTSRSSVPCRSHTPWYDGWIRTPSPKYCRQDLAPSLADRFVRGVAPLTTARTAPQALQIPSRGGHPALRLSRRQCPDLAPVLAVSVVSYSVPV